MLIIILLVFSFLIAAIWFLETKDDKSIAVALFVMIVLGFLLLIKIFSFCI